ncbi:response regulator [Mesorhizobium sp. M7A.F.Ca.MR.176.00.0.0]|uniref:response regulator n=1 Tax=Mesorhizobium sp. M7A.F.Ca.MR.176.00.0.0 TaxID=2496776 RepID=UPI000FD1D5CF|nr:response regulator [Mesorhizobium sp. M7A.F.Ca.MR.176.00.0.0]RUU90088.1 response regulator [Mesorhizobium sp. M7A.F.Ca.MR.176.00.0.0]
MCPVNREGETPRHPNLVTRDSTTEATRDPSQVLVVGKSPINRVVISKIVERSGLKPISESPDTAARILRSLIPGVVVLDGGADNKDCDNLMSSIDALRRASGKSLPPVILLSTKNGTTESLGLSGIIDVVVAKPITPERLQPVIDRLIGR